MPPAEIFIVALPLIAVLSLGVISTVRIERRRLGAATASRLFAERHGWRYAEEVARLTEGFELPITTSKRLGNPRSRNVLTGTYRGRAARSWQFSAAQRRRRGSRRSLGSGRHLSANLYHLAALTGDQELPALTMTARSGGLPSAVAGQPSQTTGETAFDRAWWGRARDQNELRSLLSAELRTRLMEAHGELDGLATRGRTLVVWRRGRQEAGDIEPLLERASKLLEHLGQ